MLGDIDSYLINMSVWIRPYSKNTFTVYDESTFIFQVFNSQEKPKTFLCGYFIFDPPAEIPENITI